MIIVAITIFITVTNHGSNNTSDTNDDTKAQLRPGRLDGIRIGQLGPDPGAHVEHVDVVLQDLAARSLLAMV